MKLSTTKLFGLAALTIAILIMAIYIGIYLLTIQRSSALSYGPDPTSPTAVLDQLARAVRWEGPWYYRMAKQTHTAKLIPTRVLDTGKLAFEVSLKRWQAAMALSRQGTNAWPVVPALVTTVMHKNISVGIRAAEALAGIHAEECPEWARLRKGLRGQTKAARTFHYLVVGRDSSGISYDLAHRRFGLLGLAATGPAAGMAYSDIVEVLKHDKEPELRACAAMALGGMEAQRPAAVALLKGVLQDKEEWPFVSASAAQGLATAAPAEAETRDLLRQALQDQRSLVRLGAARALWRLKAPAEEVLPVLTALLNHKLASTRAGALNGLSEMGSAARSSASEVQRLTSDENEVVRRAAAEALKSITGRAQAGQDSANKITAHYAGERSLRGDQRAGGVPPTLEMSLLSEPAVVWSSQG
jgi:HEAT repeat protein